MLRLIRYFGVGVVLGVVCVGIATGISVVFAIDWLLTVAILLVMAGLSVLALETYNADHPPAWGQGFWSVYTEMSGREAAGGGPSGMTRPSSTRDYRPIANAALLFVTAGVLLIIGTL